jgi:hypothetical protein
VKHCRVDSWATRRGVPSECSVDLQTGNFAVINANSSSILIYAKASGSPKSYADPNLIFAFAGYDDAGNLFVDGLENGKFGLAELPSRGETFKQIKLSQTIEAPGSIQWDGKHLTIADFGTTGPYSTSVLYRITVANGRAKKVGTTRLNEGPVVYGVPFVQTWIAGNRIIGMTGPYLCASQCGGAGIVYAYPQGSNPLECVGGCGNLIDPTGVTVSLPP